MAKRVLSGVINSKDITIYGSDLCGEKGRIVGNHQIFMLRCIDVDELKDLFQLLSQDGRIVEEISKNAEGKYLGENC